MKNDNEWYKKEKNLPFWEAGYRDSKVSTMGGPSVELYEILPALPPNARVVDLGCGEGRNALYLAKKGCEVTALDQSESAIKKLKKGAKALDVKVNTLVMDLNDFEPTGKYDLVIAHGALHFLEVNKWRELLCKLKECTKVGGFNSFSVFIPTEKYEFPKELKACGTKESFKVGDLKQFYGDWQILRCDSYAKWDKHPNIPMHVHYTEKIIARKRFDIESGFKVKSLYDKNRTLSKECFEKVMIGYDEEEVKNICGEPSVVDEVNFDTQTMGAKNLTDKQYVLRDLYYGKIAFQLINGEVRGKYIYDNEPIRLKIEK